MSKIYRTREKTGDTDVEWRVRLVCRVAERATARGEDIDVSDEERAALVWWATTSWVQAANYKEPEPAPECSLDSLFSK